MENPDYTRENKIYAYYISLGILAGLIVGAFIINFVDVEYNTRGGWLMGPVVVGLIIAGIRAEKKCEKIGIEKAEERNAKHRQSSVEVLDD